MPGGKPQPSLGPRLLIARRERSPGAEEHPMPFINVKLIEGVFTPAQKREIVRRLTDTMVEIEGENMRPVTWCVVEEVGSGDWGIAGSPLTTEDVKALARGAEAA
jgi:4-oxalocrotonate tautomerase